MSGFCNDKHKMEVVTEWVVGHRKGKRNVNEGLQETGHLGL